MKRLELDDAGAAHTMFADHVRKFDAWRAIRGCEDASGGQHDEDDGAAHEASAARVRVLCCHGYASNLQAFLSRHCKDLSSQAPTAGMLELSGIDGPAIIHDSGGRQRAWWHFEPEFPMDRTRQPDFWRLAEVGYLDAAANVELLVAEWRRGAYDGVLGFSQGAAMAAMLCARLEMLERAAEGAGAARSPRFVILVNGFRSPLPSDAELGWYRALEPASLATPALVISGEYDTAVPPSRVAELAALFGRRTEHMVRGGQHAMPRQPVDLGAIAAFVRHAIRGADPNAGGTAWH
jgi:pimeloyl-ACP methyl ester carboxylesterase